MIQEDSQINPEQNEPTENSGFTQIKQQIVTPADASNNLTDLEQRQFLEDQEKISEIRSLLSSEGDAAIVFVKEGVKLDQTLSNDKTRNTKISSFDREAYPRPPTTTFTEREGLVDLNNFLEKTLKIAREVGDQEMENRVLDFKEKFVFVGEAELQEALQFTASRIVQTAQEGKNSFVYSFGVRSEKYVSLRVLEEVDKLTEQNPEIRTRIHFSFLRQQITDKVLEDPENSRVFILDDFSISTNRINIAARHVFEGLEEFLGPEKAAQLLEIDLVADGEDRFGKDFRHAIDWEGESYPVRTYSYYKVPQSTKQRDGEWNVNMGMSVSGSHCSTDFGYEDALAEFWQFQKDNSNTRPNMPLMHNIVRAYESSEYNRNRYADPSLQTRWERMMHKYSLNV